MSEATVSHDIIRDIGDGLILRRARPTDIDPLVALECEIFDPAVGPMVRDIMTGLRPVGSCENFTIVEDSATGQIVSSLTLLDKTGTYAGIPFGIGMPEFVLTRPEYRRKGLIRAQMDLVHAWSEARGDLMQIIGGIPFYYRQFGYEMALDLDIARIGFKSYMPKLKEGETEPYGFRLAQESDTDFIAATYAYGAERYLVANIVGADLWRHFIQRSRSDTPSRSIFAIITAPDGGSVGFLAYSSDLVGDHQIRIHAFEVAPGVSWLPVTQSVVRYMCAQGEAIGKRDGKEFGTFNFRLGAAHPVYTVIEDLLPRHLGPYAWYIRIPNLPAFLQRIAPALEDRLARSYLVGHTGEIKLTFYISGVRLAFERGKLVAAEPWAPDMGKHNSGADAGFPELTFSQLLLGYRTLAELEQARPDCWHDNDAARMLLGILFPKGPSHFIF